jgi:hypothetical protein
VPGDAVGVTFLPEGATSRRGEAIEEFYPDQARTQQEPRPSAEEMVRELKQRPKAFDFLNFEFIGPDGTGMQGRTSSEEHGLGFGVLWNSYHPERARVTVRTHKLESLITKEKGLYHADAKLAFGQRVLYKVLALKR